MPNYSAIAADTSSPPAASNSVVAAAAAVFAAPTADPIPATSAAAALTNSGLTHTNDTSQPPSPSDRAPARRSNNRDLNTFTTKPRDHPPQAAGTRRRLADPQPPTHRQRPSRNTKQDNRSGVTQIAHTEVPNVPEHQTWAASPVEATPPGLRRNPDQAMAVRPGKRGAATSPPRRDSLDTRTQSGPAKPVRPHPMS